MIYEMPHDQGPTRAIPLDNDETVFIIGGKPGFITFHGKKFDERTAKAVVEDLYTLKAEDDALQATARTLG